MAKICEICGKPFDKPAWHPPFENICGKSECFEAKLWDIKAKEFEKNPKAYIVVKGHCYHKGDDHPAVQMRGFGGRKFTIKFSDGETIETTNLWDNGVVPEKFRTRIRDNAVFVDEKGESNG